MPPLRHQSPPPPATARRGDPARLPALYQAAGARFGVPWEVLAGIGKVECDHGQDPDPACAQEGAIERGRGGRPDAVPRLHLAGIRDRRDRRRRPDRWNPADAIFSAANYLKANGAPTELQRAIFAYNHSQAYVQQVLAWAATYEQQATPIAGAPGGADRRGRHSGRLRACQLGTPYRWGGEGRAGFDCSGLVQAAYRPPESSSRASRKHSTTPDRACRPALRLQPGDLVFFGRARPTSRTSGSSCARGRWSTRRTLEPSSASSLPYRCARVG